MESLYQLVKAAFSFQSLDSRYSMEPEAQNKRFVGFLCLIQIRSVTRIIIVSLRME